MRSFLALVTGCGVIGTLATLESRRVPSIGGGAEGRPRSIVATTDAGIARRNLDGLIRAATETGAAGPSFAPVDDARAARLVDLLLTRGRFAGSIADLERADAVAEELVRRSPASADGFLARAATRSAFHEFTGATGDLDRAERLGGSSERVWSLRAAVKAATGDAPGALEIRSRLVRERPNLVTLAAEAVALGEAGHHAEAEETFDRALRVSVDPSPFPVAWLHFERGRLALRSDDLATARRRFEAARDVLPWYAAATTHLGEVDFALGNVDRAVALLTAVATASDDPDAAGHLARVLGATGRPGASEWRARALARYESLLLRRQAAFADHAAEFFLAAGQDRHRALELARVNHRIRPTPEACALLERAERAALLRPTPCDASLRAVS